MAYEAFDVELPSRGVLYGDKLPGGLLRVRPMTAKEEKMFAGTTGEPVAVLRKLLQRVTITESIKIEELTATDAFFLLLSLRANSYGSTYNFRVVCPECSARIESSVTLPDGDDFVIHYFDPDDPPMEPFEVVLPRCGDVVEFRLLRVKDQDDIVKFARREKRRRQRRRGGMDVGDDSYLYRLAKGIVTINGEDVKEAGTILNVMDYVGELIGEDSSALKDAITEADSGVDTTLDLDCPECGAWVEEDMPFSAEFFRPRRRRNKGGAIRAV